jgi:thioesterase domain-containing protein
MVPAGWVALPRLPLTANGKVDYASLPKPRREHLAGSRRAGSEPRGAAERRVVTIFERVLEVEGVGAEDDFFALGGHSLLAVALFAELEKGGPRLPLAAIFEAPTPRALAALLDTRPRGARWDNLVALKPTGSRPPLFAVTAGDGNVVGFGPLARHLPAEQPLYALQPSGLDGHAAIDRGIEAMATRCVEEIRTVQPHGPYLLAGRCNGATAAYEIAQRLHGEGEEIALLAALDSDPPLAGPPELEPGLAVDHYMEAAWIRARDRGEAVPDHAGRGCPAALAAWLREDAGGGISRYAHEVWQWREDLRERWPDPLGADAGALSKWLWDSGVTEQGIEPRLLVPGLHENCRIPNGQRWDWAMAAAWEAGGCEPANPLSPDGWERLRQRLLEPVGGEANRYLLGAWERADLREHFPDPFGADLEALRIWAWIDGVEQGLDPALLPPPSGRPGRSRQLSLWLRRVRRAAAPPAAKLTSARTREQIGSGRDRLVHRVERGLGRPLPRARGRIERLLVEAGRQARAAYRADPWPGKIVLIASAQYERKPAYLAWPERAEIGVERHLLPVGHVEMLREPGAALLAECLDRCIATALET